jgi:hypothetical protein
MAIDLSTYAGLQAAVIEIMERTGDTAFAANLPSAVALAEAKLNRQIPAVETDTTLNGTANNRRISISALSIESPVALFLAETNLDEVELQQQADGTFPYRSTSGKPRIWAIDGTNIDFDCPLDSAYPFRFRYRQRFALATTSPNWLLTNHPDVYLAATMVWGLSYQEDVPNFVRWKGILEESIPEIRNSIKRSNKGTLRVDPALSGIGRGGHYDWATDA